jgi:hypothetical protein
MTIRMNLIARSRVHAPSTTQSGKPPENKIPLPTAIAVLSFFGLAIIFRASGLLLGELSVESSSLL